MNDLNSFKAFGEALAIGLLIGVERYKDRAPGEKKTAGVRTFTLFALLGAVCGLLDQALFTAMTFAGLLGLIGLGYYRESVRDIGLTTEVTALLTFWLGYLVRSHEALAVSAGIALVILLAHKRSLHQFVKEQISETEFYDTLKFLAVVFVVHPLLPDRAVGPYGFLNPARVWLLVVLISTISFSGYVLMRWLGAGRGLEISSLVGGLISTTAVTVSLAERARQSPEHARTCGVVGVMANAVQFPRLLLLISVVDRGLGAFLAVPLLGMGAVGLLGAWALSRTRGPAPPPVELLFQNPYSLTPALKFGAFFVGIFLFSRMAAVHLGERGIYLASAIAGAGDASVISLSIADTVGNGSLSLPAASAAILIAVAANALVKWALALTNGTRDLALYLGGGFATMLTVGIALTLLVHKL